MKRAGQVRIIGGQWRGRKLKVAAVSSLRPTPDRVRETLFNWLVPVVHGAHCLDAFAGTGALGFEALSRGAAHVVMVDQSATVVDHLLKAAAVLKATHVDIYQACAPEQLKKPKRPFDIVFLDPPYGSLNLLPCCFYLEENGFLADKAYIYLESAHGIEGPTLPTHWQVLKAQKAGQVAYHLIVRSKNHDK